MFYSISAVMKIEDFSRLERLLKVNAYVLRFIKAIKKKTVRKDGFITVPEIKEARILWIKSTQSIMFHKELEDLTAKKSKNSNTLVRQLKLILDEHGLIRCEGRLHNVVISDDARHPILRHPT